MIPLAFAFAMMVQADAPWYDPSQAQCYISLANAPAGAPHFEDYPAVAHPIAKRAPVQLRTRWDRLFRTNLRNAANDSPDFAGDFVVAQWGCGASCTGWAVVDPAAGRVLTVKGYENVVGIQAGDDARVLYRRSSRLIVTEGSADDENGSHDGLTYFVFNGKGFRKIAFYATREYCLPTYYGPR